MDFKLESLPLSKIDADCLVLGVFEDESADKQIRKIDKSFPASFLELVKETLAMEEFKGKSNQTLMLPTYGALPTKKILLWGLGKASDFTSKTVFVFSS